MHKFSQYISVYSKLYKMLDRLVILLTPPSLKTVMEKKNDKRSYASGAVRKVFFKVVAYRILKIPQKTAGWISLL